MAEGIIPRLKPLEPVPVAQSGPFWPDARKRIETGTITPILSNHMVATLFDVQVSDIARSWAADISSLLSETENADLARVAQYQAILVGAAEAKRQYLEAIKGYLVAKARDEQHADQEMVASFLEPAQRGHVTFSELAAQLGYPHHGDPASNPLRLLAELPLPIYLTTSPHRFLEIELAKTSSRQPKTALFYWHDGLRFIPSIFDQEPDYVPSRERPLVYHLYGLDDYPESLVLTEDDYLDYLVKLSTLSYEVKHTDTVLDIPAPVTLALTGKALLLLGFHITDWGFRVLFKGLVRATKESRKGRTPRSIAMQLAPGKEDRRQEICEYLSRYFAEADVSIFWGDLQTCTKALYQLWKGGSA